MIRYLQYRTALIRRRRNQQGLVARMLRSELVRWEKTLVARGTAVGLFWAFIPMPFQMVPAMLCCWLIRANLPIALIWVWLTNPITLPPIILLEFAIGRAIENFASAYGFLPVFYGTGAIANSFRTLITGSITLSCIAMLVGYLTISILFEISHRQQLKRKRLPMLLPSTGSDVQENGAPAGRPENNEAISP